jgi:hypothetical protein
MQIMPKDAESETQWKVTWFPPDREQVVRTGTERQVKYMAKQNAPWNPIIETREITVGPWRTFNPDAPPEEETDGEDG